MLKLDVQVPGARDRAAAAALTDGWRTIRRDVAAASVSTALAARRGNPLAEPLRPFGHPPLGRYALLGVTETPPQGAGEYGSHLLAFEPRAGQALEAEAFGRLILLVFAGPHGRDARLRRTQGGLRLTPSMMDALIARIGSDTEVELVLRPYTAPPWWAVWRRRAESLRPLSGDEPRLVEAPLDEANLTSYVLERIPRRRRIAGADEGRDASSRDEPSRPRDSGREAPFEAGGGGFGGAGASSGWDAGSAGAVRPSGVDAAGRIVGAAAAAAAVGGAIAAHEAAGAGSDRSGGDETVDADAGTSVRTSY